MNIDADVLSRIKKKLTISFSLNEGFLMYISNEKLV